MLILTTDIVVDSLPFEIGINKTVKIKNNQCKPLYVKKIMTPEVSLQM